MANSIFLKVPGAPGEAKDSGFEEQIALLGYSFGGTNEVDRHKAVGEARLGPISVTKLIDTSSCILYDVMCKGDEITEPVVITGIRAAGDHTTPMLEVTLEKATVTSISTTGSEGGGLPVETVTFAYGKIAINYKTEEDDQKEFKWNTETNTPD